MSNETSLNKLTVKENVSEKEAFYRHLNDVAMICKSEGKYLEKFDLDGEILSGKRLIVTGEGYEDAYAVVSMGEKVGLINCKKNTFDAGGFIYNGSFWIFDNSGIMKYSQYGEFCYSAFGQNRMAYLRTKEGWHSTIQKQNMNEFFKDFSAFHKVEAVMKKILAKRFREKEGVE